MVAVTANLVADHDAENRSDASDRMKDTPTAIFEGVCEGGNGKSSCLECIRVRAPKGSRCQANVWLCRINDSSVASYGGRVVAERVSYLQVFESVGRPARRDLDNVRIQRDARGIGAVLMYEWSENSIASCGLRNYGTSADRASSRRSAEAERARETARCEKLALERSDQSRITINCNVVLVDPCLKELSLYCSGKGLESAPDLFPSVIPRLRDTFKYSYGRKVKRSKHSRSPPEAEPDP
jgi:hypothetical protein